MPSANSHDVLAPGRQAAGRPGAGRTAGQGGGGRAGGDGDVRQIVAPGIGQQLVEQAEGVDRNDAVAERGETLRDREVEAARGRGQACSGRMRCERGDGAQVGQRVDHDVAGARVLQAGDLPDVRGAGRRRAERGAGRSLRRRSDDVVGAAPKAVQRTRRGASAGQRQVLPDLGRGARRRPQARPRGVHAGAYPGEVRAAGQRRQHRLAQSRSDDFGRDRVRVGRGAVAGRQPPLQRGVAGIAEGCRRRRRRR